MDDEPLIQYAESSDGYLAYQVLGSGSLDLLRLDEGTMTSIDSIADEPHRYRFDRRLASFARTIRFDRRGIGLSDGHSALAPLTLRQAALDALAVLDAANSQHAAVFGAQTAMTLCATAPDRVSHLLLLNSYARLARAVDYPWGATQAEIDEWLTTIPDPKRSSEGPDDVAILVPSLASDPQFRAHWSRAGQRGASPAVARAQMQLARFRGREVSTAGDSFFAVFDSPARAIRCAHAIIGGAAALGIDVRAGVHTGECETRGDDYSGIAVHIGARVAALAGAGEVLTTGTVRDLVAGSDIAFTDRGDQNLKGVPEPWRVFQAT